MFHADENRSLGPVFEQPDGVSSFGDERTAPLEGVRSNADSWEAESAYQPSSEPENTLPLVDPYPTAGNWAGASPYQTGNDYWNTGAAPQQQRASAGPPPYGMPAQPTPYAQQWGPYAMPAQEHPQATTVLVMGAVSFAFPLLSFVAWYMGSKAKSEIDAGAPYAYGGNLRVGHIIGKVIGIITIVGAAFSIVLLVLYFVALVGMFAFTG